MADLRFNGSTWCNMDVALRNLDFQYKLALEEHELSPIQAYILWSLAQSDGQRPSDLANAVGRVPTSFTPILDSLERRQFIVRSISPSDRRSVLISLTAEGKRVAQQASEVIKRIDERLTEAIGAERLAAFLNVVAILQAREQPQKDQTANFG